MSGVDSPTVITDPQALRALAHPLRIRLMEELAITATATATELAERVGESPANCSWHLRQLAKYGYIEAAPGGTGRQRPWRIVVETRSWGAGDLDSELVRAGDAAAAILMEHEVAALREYRARRHAEPLAWREAAGSMQSVGWCTAEELNALNEQIFGLYTRHFERITDPATRPAGARLVRFVSWGIPVRGPDHESTSVPILDVEAPDA